MFLTTMPTTARSWGHRQKHSFHSCFTHRHVGPLACETRQSLGRQGHRQELEMSGLACTLPSPWILHPFLFWQHESLASWSCHHIKLSRYNEILIEYQGHVGSKAYQELNDGSTYKKHNKNHDQKHVTRPRCQLTGASKSQSYRDRMICNLRLPIRIASVVTGGRTL